MASFLLHLEVVARDSMEDTSKSSLLTVVCTAAATSLITYALLRQLDQRKPSDASNDQPSPSPPIKSSSADKSTPDHSPPSWPPPFIGHASPSPSSSQTERRRIDPFDPSPRQGYLPWDDYFMALAFLSAERSKDPNKQVGACIVNQQRIICGIGYNGFPRGCGDSDLPWAKKSPSNDPLETKYPFVVHAEANALLNVNSASVEGAMVYVTMFPCNECAKLLIQAGISEVVYHEGKVQERVGGNPSPSPSHYPSPYVERMPKGPSSSNDKEAQGDAEDQSGKEGSCRHHESHRFKTPAKVRPGGAGGGGLEGGGGGDVMCYEASLKLLKMAGVKIRQHQLKRRVVLGSE